MIHWEKEYSTGVEEIDAQHIWIFEFSNTLEEELTNEAQKSDVGQILELLGSYCKRHFSYEEGCMHKLQCPIAGKNKSAHTQFLLTYDNFMKRYSKDGHSEALAWEIHDTVEQWISNHICQIDTHLRACSKKGLE